MILPETRGNQPYWKASRDQLAKLVAGKTVTVTWDKRDRNGRILGWIMVDQGISADKVMVLTGYACGFERYAPGEVQQAVRNARLGLWIEAGAVAQRERNGGTEPRSNCILSKAPIRRSAHIHYLFD